MKKLWIAVFAVIVLGAGYWWATHKSGFVYKRTWDTKQPYKAGEDVLSSFKSVEDFHEIQIVEADLNCPNRPGGRIYMMNWGPLPTDNVQKFESSYATVKQMIDAQGWKKVQCQDDKASEELTIETYEKDRVLLRLIREYTISGGHTMSLFAETVKQ